MANNLTKVGVNLLNMDDIEAYLHDARGFMRNYKSLDGNTDVKDIINDVENVGGIPAGNIAQAYVPEGVDKAPDRTTVRNAMMLDGMGKDDFAHKDTRDADKEAINSINDTAREEIKDLRDELYQLRAELARGGEVSAYQPYSGFYDTFRYDLPQYESEAVASADSNSELTNKISVPVSDYSKFMNGDKALLVTKDTAVDDEGHTFVRGIDKKVVTIKTEDNAGHKELTIEDGSGQKILKDNTSLYKSYGSLINGTFTFGEKNERRPGNKELVSGVMDDTRLTSAAMTESSSDKHSGVATTFRIPSFHLNNYLKSVSILAKQYGTPGDMKCYVIRENDLDKWKNPVQAHADKIVVAESIPVKAEAGKISMPAHFIDFDFYSPALESYPYLPNEDTEGEPVRYVMIFECESTNLIYTDTAKTHIDWYSPELSTYEIFYVQSKETTDSMDLETNNAIYKYDEQENESKDSPFSKMDIMGDLYYSLTMLQAEYSTFQPYSEGLYSAKFSTHEPVETAYARVTMRVAREGIYTVDGTSDGLASGVDRKKNIKIRVLPENYIDTAGQKNRDKDGFFGSSGREVIIGTQHKLVASSKGEELTLADGEIPINAGDIIYPMNYEVYLNVGYKHWDTDSSMVVTTNKKRIKLDFKGVMPDQYKINDSVSDRLIFEAPLSDADLKETYNDFEIQVAWETSAVPSDLNEHCAGRIYDLCCSLDRTAYDRNV